MCKLFLADTHSWRGRYNSADLVVLGFMVGTVLGCSALVGTVFLSPRTVSDGICPVSKLVFKCPNCQGHVLVHSTKTGAEA